MQIDSHSLEKSLNELRALAAAKLANDPLPVGREAEERIRAEIAEHELGNNVAELETLGYTILPPGKSAPMELIDRLRSAVLARVDAGEVQDFGRGLGLGATAFHILGDDRCFEEALMAPAPRTLIAYLLGYRAKLSQAIGMVKERGEPALAIHADHSSKYPAPWPLLPHYCQVTWALTDYTLENGAVCVWPGSHRWGRPIPDDMRMCHDHPEMKVLEMPAGSVLIWHGSLWHGSMPRTAEGRRVTLVFPHCREYAQTQELFWATVTPQMIERNPPLFCTLMGLTSVMPYIHGGPSAEMLDTGPSTGSHFE